MTIKKLCDQINIKIMEKNPGILVNGEPGKKDYLLREGDTIEIIPIFEGG